MQHLAVKNEVFKCSTLCALIQKRSDFILRYGTAHANVEERRGTVRAFEINKSIKTLKRF
jgi:hypothetical protein